MRIFLTTLVSITLIITPATAEQRDACHLFDTENEFVTQTLYIQMEDKRHVLTIPEIYFEDASDRVDGVEHNAQLFRMMADDFTPVTRVNPRVKRDQIAG